MTDRSVITYPAILHFSESHHYIREVNPANTMAYDRLAPFRLLFERGNTKRMTMSHGTNLLAFGGT